MLDGASPVYAAVKKEVLYVNLTSRSVRWKTKTNVCSRWAIDKRVVEELVNNEMMKVIFKEISTGISKRQMLLFFANQPVLKHCTSGYR